MKDIKFTGEAGITVTVSEGLTCDTYFNPGMTRTMSDENVKVLLEKYPTGFIDLSVKAEKKTVKKAGKKKKEVKEVE